MSSEIDIGLETPLQVNVTTEVPIEVPMPYSALQGLHKLLNVAEVRTSVVMQMASDTARELLPFTSHAADDPTRLETLTATGWARCIDESAPTLGLRPEQGPHGAPYLALAAQRIRSYGERICNVALLPAAAFSSEAVNKRRFWASTGVLVDNNATVHVGNFEYPLGIDGTHAFGNSSLQSFRRVNVEYINDPKIESVLSDKAAAAALLYRHGVGQPDYAIVDAGDPSQLERLVKTAELSRQPLAVKPPKGNRGDDVLRITPHEEGFEASMSRIYQTFAHDQLAVVQPWIQSLELRDPQTGVLQDWNIRSMLFGGVHAGSYVRYGEHGQPINIALGAEARTLQETLELAGLSASEQRLVKERLDILHKQIARAVPGNLIGADIIIDNDLQPRVIELNGDLSGGLSRIVELSNHSLDPAISAIRALNQALFRKRKPVGEVPEKGSRVSLTTEDIAIGLRFLHPETAGQSGIAKIAHLIITNSLDTTNLRDNPDIEHFIRKWDKITHDTPETAERYREIHARAALADFVKLYEAGDQQAGFELLEQYRAMAPDDLVRQQECASSIHLALDLDSMTKLADFDAPPIAASVLSLAMLSSGMIVGGLDQLALSQSTRKALIDSYRQYYLNQSADRELPEDFAELGISDREVAYLRPIARQHAIINARKAQDSLRLQSFLLEAITDPTELDLDIADTINQACKALLSSETATAEDCVTGMLASLVGGSIFHATPYMIKLGSTQQQVIDDALSHFMLSELKRAGLEVEHEAEHRYLQCLVKASNALFSDNLAEGRQQLGRFVQLTVGLKIMPYYVSYNVLADIISEVDS